MLTPKDLYALKPVETLDAWALRGVYYDHVPEAGDTVDLGDKPRVRVEAVGHVQYDHRRFWRLATVWFDGKPVMVIQNAGREGDDYAKRFVTDASLLREMADYLKADSGNIEVVPLSYDGADLVDFRGCSLAEALKQQKIVDR